MQINTTDISVLNESIHLYRHLTYTTIPASDRKNEYHKRVSPIVRSGGRSSESHIPTMKAKNIAEPMDDTAVVGFTPLPCRAITAPITQQSVAAAANHIKYSHVIVSPPYSFLRFVYLQP
jgi:hypothetical protein